MPMARRKLDRIRQIHAWMRSRYTTPFPTVLRFVSDRNSDKSSGYVDLCRRKLRISLLQTCTHHHLIDVLIHEYAHAMTWGYKRVERDKPEHPPEWGIAMATIYEDFYEKSGWKESNECKW